MLLAAVYLLISGRTGVVIAPVLAVPFSWVVFPFLLFPAGILAGMMSALSATHPKTARGLGIASALYLAALLALYQAVIFSFVGHDMLALVFAVAASATAWLVFCLKDRGNIFFIMLVLSAQASAVIMAYIKTVFPVGLGMTFLLLFLALSALLGARALYERYFMKS